MSDLIDRQAVIDDLKDMYQAAEKWGEEASDDVTKARAESCMASLIEMKLRIEKLPSAQQEVVRCKDCKWYDPTHPYGTIAPDAFRCKVNDRFYEASHFCGYGERRE